MTEEQLVKTLKQLMDDAHASYRASISSQGYHCYIQAMGAVIDRYRQTNPCGDVPEEADRIMADAQQEATE